jgi:hypothetical protein
MFTSPAAWAPVVAVILLALTKATPVASIPPTVTVAPSTNPVPVIVMAVPPLVPPVSGEAPVILGAAPGSASTAAEPELSAK